MLPAGIDRGTRQPVPFGPSTDSRFGDKVARLGAPKAAVAG